VGSGLLLGRIDVLLSSRTDEKIAFPLFGLSQFIIIIISGVLWYFNHRIANAYDRRTRAFRIIRIAQVVRYGLHNYLYPTRIADSLNDFVDSLVTRCGHPLVGWNKI
jgi:hypothetical protein